MNHALASDSDSDPGVPPDPGAEPAGEPPLSAEAVEQEAHEPDVASGEEPEPAAPARSRASIQDRVLSALKAHITPALPAELAATLEVPEKTLKRLLGKMARDGSVRRAGGGRFTISRHYHS